jgi:uncharacterized protein (TIGR03118 family)
MRVFGKISSRGRLVAQSESCPPLRARSRRTRLRPNIEVMETRSLLSHASVVHTMAHHHVPKSLFYQQTNLVTDNPAIAQAPTTDVKLKNPWGIAASPTSPFWVADNNSGFSTLYDGTGTPQSLVVTIPPPAGAQGPATPTGITFNSTSDFAVSSGGKTAPANFIFATEDGTISGWSFSVDKNNAILEVDNSAAGAVYKGLAWATAPSGNWLYATNFRSGHVDVFDTNYKPVNLGATAFTDRRIPKGFAPFGITTVNGNLLVTFAKQDAAKHDDVPGKGLGFVDLFNPDGVLIKRIASRGTLNAPWGMAVAPSNFGKFSNDLLIGNFGDGRISAFKQVGNSAVFAGQLGASPRGKTISIDGLWGLSFGNGASSGNTNTLYFTAGVNGEADGLFGELNPTPPQ